MMTFFCCVSHEYCPIGSIRPHVIGLLFRSLTAGPTKTVELAHSALRDIVAIGVDQPGSAEDSATKPKLPKELLQRSIRPVLLHLREYKTLSVPLLRGLSRLLSLLSTWFNKTLGEKMLDHLQKWTSPSAIMASKVWEPGEEPLVAAEIVAIFASLPHAAHFVEDLVKTCLKLESSLHAYKGKNVLESPYRRPLARYLNKHPQYTVAFFFPRLKTPVYSELFQFVLRLGRETAELKKYLELKQSTHTILNVCFERPLAILRSEKNTSSGSSPTNLLLLHGVGARGASQTGDTAEKRGMDVEAMEQQFQGFQVIEVLLANNAKYFAEHNDIIRAFRYLWRSRGRFLRLQHEDSVPPRFHEESRFLTKFLLSHAKSFGVDDLEVFFELSMAFLHPSTTDFGSVRLFLSENMAKQVSPALCEKAFDILYQYMAKDSTDELKILGIQCVVYPMMESGFRQGIQHHDGAVVKGIIVRFIKQVILPDGKPLACGERLRVELLRLTKLFVEHTPEEVEPFRMDLMQFCWGLLKTEDLSSKSRAFAVVCQLIASYEMPTKYIKQAFVSLLKCHQQEGKELIREAIVTLITVIPKQLSDEEVSGLLDHALQLVVEDGSGGGQQSVHVFRCVLAKPHFFEKRSRQFIKPMANGLSRIGLGPNATLDTKTLWVEMAELLVDWIVRENGFETIINSILSYSIKSKLALAEGSYESRSSEAVATSQDLCNRLTSMMSKLLVKSQCILSLSTLEEIITSESKSIGQIIACLEMVEILIANKQSATLQRNSVVVRDVVLLGIECACDTPELEVVVQRIVDLAKTDRAISLFPLVGLEKAVLKAVCDLSKEVPVGKVEGTRSNRDRSHNTGEATNVVLFGLSALRRLSDFCTIPCYLDTLLVSLLSIGKSVSLIHLGEASARQRQGAAANRTTSIGSKFHTQTIGVLEDSYYGESKSTTPRVPSEESTNTRAVEFLALILETIEANDIAVLFSQTRKYLVQLIVNLFESSDSARLLMLSVKIMGRFLLAPDPFSPLTPKERTNLLGRLAVFDFSNLSNSTEAQQLADLVYALAIKLQQQPWVKSHEVEFGKLATSCLLNANPCHRETILQVALGSRNWGGSMESKADRHEPSVAQLLWRIFHSDFEGLGGRFWLVLFFDVLSKHMDFLGSVSGNDLSILGHGNTQVCVNILGALVPFAWKELESDSHRVKLMSAMETLLSRPYHFQFLRCRSHNEDHRFSSVVRTLLNLLLKCSPLPVIDTRLLLSLAENYNSWYEVLQLLEAEHAAVLNDPDEAEWLSCAIRHCYKYLGEKEMWMSWAKTSSRSPKTLNALSLDCYGQVEDAANEYSALMEMADTPDDDSTPTAFEMDLWEERWVLLQKELCQSQVVSEFANLSESPFLQLECAWKAQDWGKVRGLCSSSALFAAVESGDPTIKMSETLLAVANGRLSEVDNLHAQTAQLCLYRWQLLPQLSSCSHAHSALFHFFHRLVEIRESSQIMVETKRHASARTVPDFKNLLGAWRHRLPNTWEVLSTWEEIFAWRSHMFSAITSNFGWSESNTLATLHDKPWSAVRMAKAARKQELRETGLFLLSRSSNEQVINVPDAFLQLRERILTYYNPDSKIERQGGLNLINMSNLKFFDCPQKSELFRLKAMFLQSLQGRAKANQAYCHSVLICPSNARAWLSWGELCASLAASIEKQQVEQSSAMSTEKANESAKKVRQYLSQAMGCFLEAMNIDGHEWSRIHIPKCLWMLTKDGPSGSLAQTFEKRATHIPAWVWLPWIPQLLTCLYRREGRQVKAVFSRLVMAYPQAAYYPLRAFYLERRDVDRGGKSTTNTGEQSHPQESVSRAEELMSLLRKTHASLWSSLESVLEELIVKFRPSNEEDLLATIVVLLDRTLTRDSLSRREEDAAVQSVWKTLGKIAVKYFRSSSNLTSSSNPRMQRASQFKEKYKNEFESDFQVSSDEEASQNATSPMTIDEVALKLSKWKKKLDNHVATSPSEFSLTESSSTLAMFGCDPPELWPGACDPQHVPAMTAGRENLFDGDPGSQTTSASAAAAVKAQKSAAHNVSAAARREGVGGDYGGGSSWIEIPGQYMPNTSAWTDGKPSPELHAKLLKFEPRVTLVKRNESLVRRIGMVGSDGRVHRFLLHVAFPYSTRTDERTAQTNYALNKVFRKHVLSARTNIIASPDPVIPVAQRLRLVGESKFWTSLDTVCGKEATLDLQSRFTHLVNEKFKARPGGTDDPPSKEFQRATRLEVFQVIRSDDNVDDNKMLDFVSNLTRSPENLHHFRRFFAQQWAINCLFQYAFSAGDRPPSKVTFDCCDAQVFSPEFRIAYNNQGCFESQSAPFRLSPNIARLIGPTLIDAKFATSIAIAADAIFSSRQDIDAIFRLLIRDDLVSYCIKGVAKPDQKTLDMERQLMPSIGRNVATMHTRFSECSTLHKQKESRNANEPIDYRVRKLVEAAQNPENQAMMSSNYQGWV